MNKEKKPNWKAYRIPKHGQAQLERNQAWIDAEKASEAVTDSRTVASDAGLTKLEQFVWDNVPAIHESVIAGQLNRSERAISAAYTRAFNKINRSNQV